MQHLFSPEGEAALAAVLRLQPLMAFDFDGTLAPIVARPTEARIPQAIVKHLRALAQRLPVAIVSGRAVGDVRQRLGFEPHFVLGSHGAEDDSDPLEDREDGEALSVRVRRRIPLEHDVLP